MNNFINKVNELRNIFHRQELNLSVKKVVVILTSSRSGSSLVKKILASHPDIASLDGEIDPFLVLSKNGFGYDSDSDAIVKISNKNELLDNIFDNLTIPTEEMCSFTEIKERWIKRFLLQFPNIFSDDDKYKKLLEVLDKSLKELGEKNVKEEKKIHELILSEVFKEELWRVSYYDGFVNKNHIKPFHEEVKIEEPPFVTPSLHSRSFTASDSKNKTLLFKTPQDSYHIGMYEQLFPNAEIKYIHLTRGYAQSVNGLMDGWLYPLGFFSHNMRAKNIELNIKDYSNTFDFGKSWWKFDLPPNWHDFINSKLIDVCANQWLSAHKTIIESEIPVLQISFEEILSKPKDTFSKITKYLNLAEIEMKDTLPLVMTIDKPKDYRWRKRENEILALGERKEIKEMMEVLGYSMNPETWL